MSTRFFNLGVQAATFLAVFAWSAAAVAADVGQATSDDDVNQAFDFLGKLNRASELEPAGSRGSIGLGLGAGMTRQTLPEGNAVLAAQLSNAELGQENGTGAAVAIPRLWLVKGLPLPLDVGFSGGSERGAGLTQATGYLQWTVYESLGMPALAVRGSYGRLYGLEDLNLATEGVEALAGIGLLRYFTVFGRAGYYRHHGALSITEQSRLAFLITETDEPHLVERSWTETVRGVGLRIMVLPPFVTLTGEMEMTGAQGETKDYAAKLSFGM